MNKIPTIKSSDSKRIWKKKIYQILVYQITFHHLKKYYLEQISINSEFKQLVELFDFKDDELNISLDKISKKKTLSFIKENKVKINLKITDFYWKRWKETGVLPRPVFDD